MDQHTYDFEAAQARSLTFLDEHSFSFTLLTHPACFTVPDIERYLPDRPGVIVKNLFLRDQKGKRHFLVLLREDVQANLTRIGEELCAGKLSFCSEDRLMRMLGVPAGSVTPMALLNDPECRVEVYADRELSGIVGIHPLVNTATVWMDFDEVLRLISLSGHPLERISV